MTDRSLSTWLRSTASAVLLVLAVIFIVLGSLAWWLRAQVLDTDTWVDTSRATLQQPEVRDAVATWAVDQLFDRTQPEELLGDLLPGRTAILAGPFTSRLRAEAYEVADAAVADPKTEELWVRANRRAHERFVRVVEGDDPIIVESPNGIRIDLRPMLEQIADRIGFGEKIVDRIPSTVASVKPKRTEQVERGLEALRLLDKWGPWIGVLSLPLLVGGILLSRNRRAAWAWVGAGSIVAAILMARVAKALGPVIAETLTESTTWQKAVLTTWQTMVQGVLDSASALAIVGAAAIVLAWVTAAGAWQRRARKFAAPVLVERPAVAVGIGGFLALLVVSYVPVLESRRAFVQLLLVIGACAVAWTLSNLATEEATADAAPADEDSVPSQP